MADNITAPAAGTVLATDDIGGVQYPRTKLSIGADGTAVDCSATNPLPALLNPTTAVVSATFNRPADTAAYAIGDLVANSTTAGSVTPLSFTAARVNGGVVSVHRVRLSTSKTGLAGTEAFRVHLFRTTPTVVAGDNGAYSANGVASVYLGPIDVVLSSVQSDGAIGFALANNILAPAASGAQTLYGLIEARSAYTPASGETFTVTLELYRE